MKRTRVLLVEDDPALCESLAELLASQDDLALVGVCGSAAKAIAFEGELDLAVVDLGLPDGSGVEVIRVLRARDSGIDLMAHTIFEEKKTVFEAIVAGASGYVLKGSSREDFLAALRELRAGGAPMTPRIARYVVGAFQQQGSVADHYTLSAREREVLTWLEDGLSYKEAAAKMHVSTHTVHTHIKRIYEKLHAHSKAEALTKAKLRGIL